jgi:uncharacterized protein involved in exopolysaccharide biosynthesis
MNDSLSFLKPYLRGWPIILLAMVVGYVGASKYLNYVTPMYESTAKLRLADIGEGVPHSNLYKDLDVFVTNQKLNAEIEVLKSSVLLDKVLDSLGFGIQIFRVGSLKTQELYRDSPISVIPIDFKEKQKDRTYKLHVEDDFHIKISYGEQVLAKGKIGDTLQLDDSWVYIKMNDLIIDAKENIKIPDEYEFIIDSKQKLMADLSKNLDVSAVDKDVAVIRISYKSAHPLKAALLPNTLAEAYIQDYIDTKFSAANVTVDFLDDRIENISKQLVNVENQILGYRNNHKITNISQETETDLRKLSQMKIQQTNLKMSLDAIIQLESYVTKGRDNFLDLAPNFEAFTDLLSTEIIKKIKQLQSDKRDLKLQYTDKDPRVMIIDKKIEDLTSYLIESITNTRKNLESKYNNLLKDIEKVEAVFVEVPEKEKMLTVLNREFNIYQQSYNFLNEKKIEAEIAKAAKIAFHRIITPAFESKVPVSPNRAIIKIVTSILCLMGALGFIFIVHSLKAKVNDTTTVENNSMIPIAAEVPKIIGNKKEHDFFLKLLANWEVKKLVEENKIISFSAYSALEGSSYLTKNIVKSFVFQNRKVLLIDFYSAIYPDIIEGNTPIKVNDHLYVLNIKNDLFKAFSSAGIQEWISKFTSEFEQVIVLNEEIGNQFTLSVMAISKLNLICIDTRITTAKRITEIDILKDEYQIPNLFFAINRVGYTPSLIREIIKCAHDLIRKTNYLIKKKMNA